MIKPSVLILERTDLIESSKNKNISDIEIEDFVQNEPFNTYGLVLFVSAYGSTKIIKNRFGDSGAVKVEPIPRYDVSAIELAKKLSSYPRKKKCGHISHKFGDKRISRNSCQMIYEIPCAEIDKIINQ